MLLSGSTFVKNAVKFSYPVKATIDSLLAFTDEVFLNIGVSDDKTVEYINDLYATNPKVKIFIREWPGKDQGTLFYRQETNFIIDKATGKFHLHLQSDEVVHENDRELLYKELERYKDNDQIFGLRNRFIHFEGDFVSLRGAYQAEIRVLRSGKLEAWGDAQSFKIKGMDDQFIWNLKVKETGQKITPLSNLRIFHLGFVRPPKAMFDKTWDMDANYNKGDRLKELQANMEKDCPGGLWTYKHWNAMVYHDTLPIYCKEYVRKFEKDYPQLIRIPARFEDEPDVEANPRFTL